MRIVSVVDLHKGSTVEGNTILHTGNYSAQIKSQRGVYKIPEGESIKSGTEYTLPNEVEYRVSDFFQLMVYRDGMLQSPTIHYEKVGREGETSNKIQFLYDLPEGTVLDFISP